MQGWIKLHRKLLRSNMYRSLNSKQRDVLMSCLMMANHDTNEWEYDGGLYKCEAGQFVTSLDKICSNCASDVKVQSVRTALLKLEKWGFLTNKSTKTGRLITICKWGEYQDEKKATNKDKDKDLTKKQQRPNKDLTTNKNDKNINNDKNNNITDSKNPTPPKKSKEELLLEREEKFKIEVYSYNDYPQEMLKAFFMYWSEPNKSRTKMLWETKPTFDISRRLANWASRDKSFNPKANQEPYRNTTEVYTNTID